MPYKEMVVCHLPRLRFKPTHTNTYLLTRTVFIPLLGWKENEMEKQIPLVFGKCQGFPLVRRLETCWFIRKNLGCRFPTQCRRRPTTCMQLAQLLSPGTCQEQVPRETGGWITAATTPGGCCQIQAAESKQITLVKRSCGQHYMKASREMAQKTGKENCGPKARNVSVFLESNL